MNLLGKLTWQALPLDQPIPDGDILHPRPRHRRGHHPRPGQGLGAVSVARMDITSVDHKRIGVMYCLLGFVMLLRGFSDALMMRAQQALALHSNGFLQPEHYNQIFSAHGTIMIFFVAMPLVIGMMNFRRAAPARRARRGLPDPELGGLLANGHGRPAGQHVPGSGGVRPHRLVALSAAVGAAILAGGRGRLLPVGAADIRGRRHC